VTGVATAKVATTLSIACHAENHTIFQVDARVNTRRASSTLAKSTSIMPTGTTKNAPSHSADTTNAAFAVRWGKIESLTAASRR